MRRKSIFDISHRFGSSDSVLKQQLLWMLLLRVILYTLLLGVNFLLQDDKFEVITLPPNLMILFVLAVYISTIGSAFYLIRSDRNLRKFGFIRSPYAIWR